MNSTKIRIGLASFGLSGQVFHAPFIEQHPHLILSHVVERTNNLSEMLYSKPKVLLSYDELLVSDVDVVVVNTPSYLHFEMAKQALMADKHVILEKPFTACVLDAQILIDLARDKGLVLAVFHNRRLESGFKTVKSILHSDILGDIKYYKAHFNRDKFSIGTKKWKEQSRFSASGLFFDLAPHLIDQALVLFGYPDAIDSVLKKQRPLSEVIDYFLITLRYAKGLTVELEASTKIDILEPKYCLKGALGSFTKSKEDHQEWLLRQGIFPSYIDPDNGEIKFVNGEQRSVRNVRGSYADFYVNFYNVLVNKVELLIKPEEALDVMRVMEACK